MTTASCSVGGDGDTQQQRNLNSCFSVHRSTEENHRSESRTFYGPYAHIRENTKQLDYTYHSNHVRQRQSLQDFIIHEFLEDVAITDINGDVCTTPTETWIVFTAGAMGAGKGRVVNELVEQGRFPVLGFVTVDP